MASRPRRERVAPCPPPTAPPPCAPSTVAAASSPPAASRRVYGEGETAVHALRGVDLDIEAGRLTAVMGPSGSGKSTLMHLLAGLDQPDGGTVHDRRRRGHRRSTTRASPTLRREHIGFVFQFFNLLPMLTAQENILLPLEIAGRDVDPAWFDELIDKVGPGRPPRAPPERDVRRPAAARRRRPRARRPADGRVRRRADRQPGLDDLGGDPRPAALGRRRLRPDDRDGHARPARGGRSPTASCSWPTAPSSATCARATRTTVIRTMEELRAA